MSVNRHGRSRLIVGQISGRTPRRPLTSDFERFPAKREADRRRKRVTR
jgi:hypothetical protein